MKKAGVAGFQLGEEFVNLFLEFFRVFKLQNPSGPGFNEGLPIHAVEFGVEVSSLDEAAHLVEYGFSVLAAEVHLGSDKRLAPSPVIVNPAQ